MPGRSVIAVSLPPCKDCPDRKLRCHDSCERFQSWKAEREKGKLELRDLTASNPKETRRFLTGRCSRKSQQRIREGRSTVEKRWTER